MGKITIADVAERTGFSKTTISRYLNGKYEYMSAATRERISEVIKEIEYKPNKMARSLRLQQSHMIGVIVSDISSPFSAILYSGIADWCEEHGFTVLLADAADDPQKERRYIQSMIAQGVDGIVINATGAEVEYLNEVNRSVMPIVLADRPVAGCDCDLVSSDTEHITEASLDLLLSKGYERILFATRRVGTNGIRRLRFDEFVKQYEAKTGRSALTLEYDKTTKDILTNTVMTELAAARQAKERFAVFAGNGVVLSDIAKITRQQQLTIPQDLGVYSYDNWTWMDVIGPGISVVELPTYEIGQECARLLVGRIKESLNEAASEVLERQKVILPCSIVERQSL
ncbi:LacI family DNA-binding transcriptional regulator [Veillonella intestinalis]|uniref:LacI family DNA-binding transcriptional regulator n=1 Tax=Veillonella intestinalis TaxID=2941341 RepID=UPI00203BA4C7|nr:LacI family DNA-binding transcriptional regulator [Veillonella intestinalis]